MKHITILSLLTTLIFATSCSEQDKSAQNNMPNPPVAKKADHPLTIHGDTRNDPYYWMRLSDEQKESATPDQQTKDVVDYLNAENAYTKAIMAHTETFQNNLFEEMKGRIKETDMSVPVKDNGYWYYTRFEQGQDYAYYCRKKDSMETGKEEILVNGPDLAKGHD